MSKKRKKKILKTGKLPGTLIYTGSKGDGTEITLYDYDAAHIKTRNIKKIEDCFPFKQTPTVTWININGLNHLKTIEKIGKHFEIHPLILEDILNINQRPKIEDLGSYIFTVIKMLSYNEKTAAVEYEQVSMILGKNFLITFQEREGDVFEIIRKRLVNNLGRIRSMDADYLLYSLIDAVVDQYFIILEKLGDMVEEIEDEVISNPSQKTLEKIHHLKNELIILRKSVWPLREVIGYMEKTMSNLLSKETSIYFRDIYDHTIQIIDTIETYRDIISGTLDIYLSSVSNKMNNIMKVLTIIGTIFMPLTFITGIYGMNFKYMPELHFKYSYPIVLVVMLIIGIGLILYFKKKKWL